YRLSEGRPLEAVAHDQVVLSGQSAQCTWPEPSSAIRRATSKEAPNCPSAPGKRIFLSGPIAPYLSFSFLRTRLKVPFRSWDGNSHSDVAAAGQAAGILRRIGGSCSVGPLALSVPNLIGKHTRSHFIFIE